MKQEQILDYLDLVNRRLYILTHSGIDWKPEYAAELEEIDKKLVTLRPLVDAEHAKRVSDAPAADENEAEEDNRAEILSLLEDVRNAQERLESLQKYFAENFRSMSVDEIRGHMHAERDFEQLIERDDDRLAQLGSCAGDNPALYADDL